MSLGTLPSEKDVALQLLHGKTGTEIDGRNVRELCDNLTIGSPKIQDIPSKPHGVRFD